VGTGTPYTGPGSAPATAKPVAGTIVFHTEVVGVNNRLCAAFLPWLVFDLVVRTGTDGLTFAALAALVTALAIAAANLRARATTTVENTSMVMFSGLAIAATIASPGPGTALARCAVALTTSGLALVLLVSLMRVPVTAEYSRNCVRPSAAESPRFAIINMTLTALWGTAFALVAGSQAVAAFVGGQHVASVFGWLVPLGILLAVAKATAGLWADYHEREVARGQGASLVDGLLWDFPPSFDDEL
jgi:hypothetical protein